MNLKQVRIKNFRNLKDVTVNLNDVNLLIGPNNSGKSNVLHAIRLGSMIVQRNLRNATEINYTNPIDSGEFIKWLTSTGLQKDKDSCILTFVFDLDETTDVYLICSINNSIATYIEWGIVDGKIVSANILEEDAFAGIFLYVEKPRGNNYNVLVSDSDLFSNLSISSNTLSNDNTYLLDKGKEILKQFVNLPIYEIAPKELRKPYGLTSDKFIEFDGSNIVSFLGYISFSREDIKEEIKKTLSLISKDFSGFRIDAPESISNEIRNKFPRDTIQKFGLIDSKSYENTIWAEYLSDGILYFLALLCVVHQPYPPPILLLEEPEKGIHPRRIREVMDLLFALAEEKKIQIILTTHSTFVVDEFSDVPENVTVFDNNEETITVKNLKNDILKKIDDSLEKNNYPKDYLEQSLGENWALGLLGGIPN